MGNWKKKYTKSHFIYDVISLWNCVKFLFDEWSFSKKKNSTRTFWTRTNVLFIHEMSFSNKKTHQQTVNILSRTVFKINHKKYKHHIDKETFDSLIEPLLSSPVHRYYRVYIYKKRKIWINLVLNVFWFWCENRIGFPILIEYFRKSAHHLKANLTKERHKFEIIWIYVN